MTGFSCNVEGGKTGATLSAPQPAKHCPGGDCVSGPKQPLYWANDNSNIDFSGEYEQKPTYNTRWGFKDGAQDIGISGGSSAPAPVESDVPATSPVEDAPETTAAPEPVEDEDEPVVVPTTMVTRTRKSSPQPTLEASCSWEGHCAGDSCRSWSDCSDDLVCFSGTCGSSDQGGDFN